MTEDLINPKSSLPRIAMVSTYGFVAANPPLGAADTGGQVVYVLELSKKLAQLGCDVESLSSVVRRLVRSRLPRTTNEPGEPGQ